MDNNSIDLRSVIGWFFIIISLFLIFASITTENGSEINRITGISFLVFGLVMFSLSRIGKKKAKGTENNENH